MTSLPFSSTPSIMSMPQAQPKMPSVNAAATDDKLKKTAQDFESVALGELLQPMFETVDTSKGMFGGGAAEGQFRSLQVLELGKQISKSGGIGIAHQVYRAMQKMQANSTTKS